MKITRNAKTILLCTVAITLGAHSAQAQTSGPRYTPRTAVMENNYTNANRVEDTMDNKSYGQYDQREPCQNYRKPPRDYSDNCVSNTPKSAPTVPMKHERNELLPIVHSYTVLFDFDKSNVRANESATLDQVMHEISKYNPQQITVTGYTDSSGAAEYNQILSRKREQAVSKGLLKRGIQNQTIDHEARGEFDQAVATPDDTRNQENRRVVIDFRR